MSGGIWNYGQCNLGYDMFPGCDVCYGLGNDSRSKYSHDNYTSSVKLARKLDPMEDKQLSELVFDVLCLVYSADLYKSDDIGKDTYLADVQYFKKKWLNQNPENIVKSEIDKAIEETKDDLYKSFGLNEGVK